MVRKPKRWVEWWHTAAGVVGHVMARNGNVVFTVPGAYNSVGTMKRVMRNQLDGADTVFLQLERAPRRRR